MIMENTPPLPPTDLPLNVDYVYHPTFSLPSTEDRLYGDSFQEVYVPAWSYFSEHDASGARAFAKPKVLKPDEERRLFLKYNYARYRLGKVAGDDGAAADQADPAAVQLWHERACDARATLVRANMALVLAMAKRMQDTVVEFEELVSEGNMALLRSIDKFDVSRGFRFSTYACTAILKSFHRLASKAAVYRQHFPAVFEPEMERSDQEAHKHETEWQDSVLWLQRIFGDNRAQLSEVERTVVIERFGLASRDGGKTLSAIGRVVGLSTERVRQLLTQALDKIRLTLDKCFLAA